MIVVDDARVSPLKFFTEVITSQPANASGVIGGQASFTFTYLTNNPTLVTLNWQVQMDGATWADLVETAGFYEGVTTATLTVKSIDNFMAAWPTRKFRCRLLFSGSVPTFTNSATLSIPIHTDWRPRLYAAGYAQAPTIVCFTAQTLAFVVTGLSGPLTYNWTYFDGDVAIQCNGTFLAQPTFFRNFDSAGVKVARWICTISDGTNTVASDPVIIACAWSDAGFTGSVSVLGITGTVFDFTWLTFLFPPDPFVSSTPAALYPLRNTVQPGFTLTQLIFDPLTMNYFFIYTNTSAPNPGSSQIALYSVKLENPVGTYGYLIGISGTGFVIHNFEPV